jgi:hypothetical protein
MGDVNVTANGCRRVNLTAANRPLVDRRFEGLQGGLTPSPASPLFPPP